MTRKKNKGLYTFVQWSHQTPRHDISKLLLLFDSKMVLNFTKRKKEKNKKCGSEYIKMLNKTQHKATTVQHFLALLLLL